MFLGGAGHAAERIRGSSVKGALAFWWRAFHYAHHVRQAGGNVDSALGDLRAREKQLFGSADGGQGRFLLRVQHGEFDTLRGGSGDEIGARSGAILRNGRKVVGVGARYLGYGVVNAFDTKEKQDKNKRAKKAGELERDCIRLGQTFSVELLFRPGGTDDDRREMGVALKLLGLLGGLGSRVRRGWGSVALVRMEEAGQDWQPPVGRADYLAKLRELFSDHPFRDLSGADWPLTAFARESGVWVSDTDSGDSLHMLDRLGRAMLNYRGMGRGAETKVDDQPILKQFWEDHDWFRKGANDVYIPYRSAFGLPHMYNSKQGIGVVPQSSDRRASPLMLHVHKAGSEAFGVAAVFPNRFIEGKIVANRRGDKVEREYDLMSRYGSREASGLDVLRDFLGAGPSIFTPNTVVKFQPALP